MHEGSRLHGLYKTKIKPKYLESQFQTFTSSLLQALKFVSPMIRIALNLITDGLCVHDVFLAVYSILCFGKTWN